MNQYAINALIQAITDSIEIHDEFMDCNTDSIPPTASRHILALATAIENALRRNRLDFDLIYALFGAPGDWGYSTRIGKALQALYRAETRHA